MAKFAIWGADLYEVKIHRVYATPHLEPPVLRLYVSRKQASLIEQAIKDWLAAAEDGKDCSLVAHPDLHAINLKVEGETLSLFKVDRFLYGNAVAGLTALRDEAAEAASEPA